MNISINTFVEFGNHLQELQKTANVLATHLYSYKYNVMFPNNPSLKLVMMKAQEDIVELKQLCVDLKNAYDRAQNGERADNINELLKKFKEYCEPIK